MLHPSTAPASHTLTFAIAEPPRSCCIAQFRPCIATRPFRCPQVTTGSHLPQGPETETGDLLRQRPSSGPAVSDVPRLSVGTRSQPAALNGLHAGPPSSSICQKGPLRTSAHYIRLITCSRLLQHAHLNRQSTTLSRRGYRLLNPPPTALFAAQRRHGRCAHDRSDPCASRRALAYSPRCSCSMLAWRVRSAGCTQKDLSRAQLRG